MKIGLDIGSHSIKIVCLKNGILENYSIINLDLEKELEDRISEGLKQLVGSFKFKKIPIAIGINGPDTIVKYITLPKMTEDELKEAMKFEIETHIPLKKEEIYYDFHIFSEDAENIKVVIASAKINIVQGIIKLLEKYKIRAKLLVPDSIALLNSFIQCNPSEVNIALLNIGFQYSNLNIIGIDGPFISRIFEFGSANFVNLISSEKNCSLNEADKILFNDEEGKNFIYMGREIVDSFIDEITSSITYYEVEKNQKIEKIYLSGGFSIKEIAELFKEKIGIEIFYFNPVERLKLTRSFPNLEEDKNRIVIAIGLAFTLGNTK